MSKDRFDAVVASVPLNGTAGRVTSRGTHYDPKLKAADHMVHSDVPPPMRPVPRLASLAGMVGRKFGRFTVLGLAAEGNPKKEAGWVCRCVCGAYEIRKAKAIRNPKNADDACRKCRDWAYKKRTYERLGPKPIDQFVKASDDTRSS